MLSCLQKHALPGSAFRGGRAQALGRCGIRTASLHRSAPGLASSGKRTKPPPDREQAWLRVRRTPPRARSQAAGTEPYPCQGVRLRDRPEAENRTPQSSAVLLPLALAKPASCFLPPQCVSHRGWLPLTSWEAVARAGWGGGLRCSLGQVTPPPRPPSGPITWSESWRPAGIRCGGSKCKRWRQ